MKKIQELVENTKKYNNVIIQKELKSKKNTVAYVTINDKPRVLKMFVPGFKKQMENEYKFLTTGAKKVNVPFVYEKDDKNNVLTMNYIFGENLCDIINSKDTIFSEKERLMMLLAQWYEQFHTYYKQGNEFIIRGDPNIRNFLLSDQIFGVDLEEARKGHPVEDIAGTCASILATDPMFTNEKFRLCRIFIDSYLKKAPGRILNINNEIAYALLEKIQWRPDDENILRKNSKKIREKGLTF